jgi:16S rRNA (uracil1498-N3)-methyltransferase
VVERAHGARVSGARPTVATFVTDGALPEAGAVVALGEDAAHHMRVRRMAEGEAVALRDGIGGVGEGRLARLAKARAEVQVASIRRVPPPPPVHLLVPVADRDRMLWLAEKAVELGVASWRPVVWHRSRSVSPRGEGEAFRQKVRARMVAALQQCDGAWLPTLHDEASLDAAIAAAPGQRLVLDPDGEPLGAMTPVGEVSVAVGPEGGIEADELVRLDAAGFRRAALPGNILRFETAGVVGAAFARALVERGAR